jgi:AcrR family transcriptional regulator
VIKRKDSKDGAGSTRSQILDAAEAILSADGYAAVTSRAIAEKANLKSRLVHYYFGTMDDLFLAVIRRIEDRYFAATLQKMTSGFAAQDLLEGIMSNVDTRVMQELSALALRRDDVRDEVARVLDRARQMDIAMMEKLSKDLRLEKSGLSPTVLALLMAGAIRVLTEETAIGVTRGHDELLAYFQTLAQRAPRS